MSFKLEVGKTFFNNLGVKIFIEGARNEYYWDHSGNTYTKNGKSTSGIKCYDLSREKK